MVRRLRGGRTTALLFFQIFLLLGYAYAHFVVNHFSARAQGIVHVLLLAGALAVLPIAPSDGWKPTDPGNPTWRIFALLAANIGLPYFLLSSTGPLIQAWQSRRFPGRSPYRLYALSNTASLLALLTYPVLFERYLSRPVQSWLWSGGYVLFALCCGGVAWCLIRTRRIPPAIAGASVGAPPAAEPLAERRPSLPMAGLWLALAAFGSMLLLVTTNQITQDVAAIPLLWIVPLSLYLLSFVICFDAPRWYVRPLYTATAVAASIGAVYALDTGFSLGLVKQIVIYSAALFFLCMSLHGELARRKPQAQYLTLFYLMVAAGGALGGSFVVLLAPRIFSGLWEYHVALWGSGAVVLISLGAAYYQSRVRGMRRPVSQSIAQRRKFETGLLSGGAVAALVVFGLFLKDNVDAATTEAVARERNFYAVLQVQDIDPDDPNRHALRLVHGQILH